MGLFPSNFVTADLTAEPEMIKTEKKTVQFSDDVQIETIEPEPEPEPAFIDEDKMDQLLQMLQSTDPSDNQPDLPELLHLEAMCHQMGPLIDEKLEDIDRKHSELSELNVKVMEALSLYTKLMNEDPVYSVYAKSQSQQYYVQASGVSAPQVYPGPAQSGAYLVAGNAQMTHLQSYSLPRSSWLPSAKEQFLPLQPQPFLISRPRLLTRMQWLVLFKEIRIPARLQYTVLLLLLPLSLSLQCLCLLMSPSTRIQDLTCPRCQTIP